MKQTTLDVSTTDIPDDLFTDPFPEQSVENLQTWVENRINDETIPIADDELAHTIEGKSAFSPDAKFLLGVLYEYGIGVARSSEKAEEHILISASRGCADARFHLAVCYETGAFGKVNYFKAAKWFSKAADGGIEEAYLFYGKNCLRLYEETKLDYFSEEALDALWAVAYDMPEANAELARCYMRGIGTKVSLDVAETMIDYLECEGYDVTELKTEYSQLGEQT